MWLPAARSDLVSVADAALRATGLPAVPSTVNVTDPVGVPAPGASTLGVAMKVTESPALDGFSDDVMIAVNQLVDEIGTLYEKATGCAFDHEK